MLSIRSDKDWKRIWDIQKTKKIKKSYVVRTVITDQRRVFDQDSETGLEKCLDDMLHEKGRDSNGFYQKGLQKRILR